MTLEETRQLGIEFERRLLTMFPATKLAAKIDTEDIYSFLNQYQAQYVQQLYMSEGQLPSNTRASILVQDILRTLTDHVILRNGISDNSIDVRNRAFKLPKDYYLYVRSTSEVVGTYKYQAKKGYVPNRFVTQSDMFDAINGYFDKGRIIRKPLAMLEGNTLKVLSDQYTVVDAVDLTYIRMPANFSVLTSTPCELPFECFGQLVAGALDLYIAHILAALPKEQKKNQKEERDDK